jgi:nucleotide-binding universal stress UspA family protein
MVAYGGGKEVARTLQTIQLLGLAQDETVHLVSVRAPERSAETLVPLAAEFLKCHAVRQDVHVIENEGETADILLDAVTRLQPRLLVMGSPGYHPLRDLFLTSVTRAVVSRSPVPVLIGA